MKRLVTRNGTEVLTLLKGRSGVFAVRAGKKFLVVDTSTAQFKKRLFGKVDALIEEGNVPVGLVLTHVHFDHVENAAAFCSRYEVPLYCHESEEHNLREGNSAEISGAVALTKALTNTFPSVIMRLGRFECVEPTHTFLETLDLPDIPANLTLLHTPGHTVGSSSLIIDGEIALVGDTVFGIMPYSSFPIFAVDNTMVLKSWRKLLDTGCEVFLPAHGSARQSNQLLKGLNRKHKKN